MGRKPTYDQLGKRVLELERLAAYLIKPIMPDDITSTIEQSLKIKPNRSATKTPRHQD